MKRMTHLLVFLLVGLGALAMAQDSLQLAFRDAGFNYYGGQNGTKTGYVHMAYQGDRLTVSLSATPSAMPVKFAELVRAVNSSGGLTAWHPMAIEARTRVQAFKLGARDGVTITHQGAFLGAVMDAYDAALRDLGLSGASEATYTNVRILNYVNGSGSMRVIFTRLGNEITIRMLES